MKRFLFLFLLASAVSGQILANSALDFTIGEKLRIKKVLKSHPGIKYSDIDSWALASDRYAKGYDNGELVAIYDLAYPSLRNSKHLTKTILGSFGVGNVGLDNVIAKMKELLKQKNDRSEFENRLLATLLKDAPLIKVKELNLSGQWWKKISFLSSSNAQNAQSGFYLSDIKIDQGVKDTVLLKKHMSALREFFTEANDLPSGFDFFSLIKITPSKNGFDVSLDHTRIPNLEDRPRKIIDLKYPDSSFRDTLIFLAAKETAELIPDLIPEPITAGVLNYAVSRWFRLFAAQKEAHLSAALELINQNELRVSRTTNSLSFLNSSERQKAGQYIVNYRPNVWSVIKRLYQDREDLWKGYIKEELETAKKSLAELNSRGYENKNVTPWFLHSKKSELNKIYALSERSIGIGALEAIDYEHPEKELIYRYSVEITHAALDAASISPFYVASAVKAAFGYLFKDKIKRMKRWEARLSGHFLSEINEGNDYTNEIALLYLRRMNPFAYSLKEENELAKARRALLKL